MSAVSKGPYVVTGLLLAMFACSADDNFREDVFFCEEAVAALADCCPGFDPSRIDCTYDSVSSSCGQRVTREPAFSLDESRCILARSCEGLTADICERAQNAASRVICSSHDAYGCPSTDGPSPGPVCP